MPDGIIYCLNLNLSICFRVGSRRNVTIKAKLYVRTVNNNFQPLSIFCHKEVHLTCCLGLELIIVKWFTKILKGIEDTPMTECNLGKIQKTNSPGCLKNLFSEVFHMNFFLHLIWNELNGTNINSLT